MTVTGRPFQQLWVWSAQTYVVLRGGDSVFAVLTLEMSQFDGQRVLVVQQRDDPVQSAEHALRVSLEVRRVGVVAVHAGEQCARLRVVVEDPARSTRNNIDVVLLRSTRRVVQSRIQCTTRTIRQI